MPREGQNFEYGAQERGHDWGARCGSRGEVVVTQGSHAHSLSVPTMQSLG